MSKLVIDPTYLRMLENLDRLCVDDIGKADEILNKASGDGLRRLFKNSIARQTIPGLGGVNSDAAQLVEVLVHNNVFSFPGDANEEEFDKTVSVLNDGVLRLLVKISLVRYRMLELQGM